MNRSLLTVILDDRDTIDTEVQRLTPTDPTLSVGMKMPGLILSVSGYEDDVKAWVADLAAKVAAA